MELASDGARCAQSKPSCGLGSTAGVGRVDRAVAQQQGSGGTVGTRSVCRSVRDPLELVSEPAWWGWAAEGRSSLKDGHIRAEQRFLLSTVLPSLQLRDKPLWLEDSQQFHPLGTRHPSAATSQRGLLRTGRVAMPRPEPFAATELPAARGAGTRCTQPAVNYNIGIRRKRFK